MRVTVVQKLLESIPSLPSWSGLISSNGTEGLQHGWINRARIIKECTYDLLDFLLVRCVKWRWIIDRFRHLDSYTILRRHGWIRRVLRLIARDKLKLFQCFPDISWHRDSAGVLVPIPIQMHSHESRSVPVLCNFIVSFERSNQVLYVFLPFIFDSKIVDTQYKLDRSLFMFPKSWSMAALVVPFLS